MEEEHPIDWDIVESDPITKKCPVCNDGTISFWEREEGYGDCDNSEKHECEYDTFQITSLNPFTVNHIQDPLRTYVIPVEHSGLLTEGGMKFTLRDSEDHNSVVEAVLLSLEGMLDWVQHELADSIGWGEVEWGDYEEHDDGISEYILEDPEVESE
jgi:hypothetical protein